MAEFENLESLSNSELRNICNRYGLPNVPITDSSKSLLIKKLRALADPAQVKKTSNRRETIASVEKIIPITIQRDEDENKKKASRRTVSAAPAPIPSVAPAHITLSTIEVSVSNDAENPSVVVSKKPTPLETKTQIPAPIGGRRRSSMREQVVQQQTSAPSKPIEEYPPIIIEDDEDDDLLAKAAEKAEKITVVNRDSPAMGKTTTRSRSASLSKTDVVTTSTYVGTGMSTVPEYETINLTEPTGDSGSTYKISTNINEKTTIRRGFGEFISSNRPLLGSAAASSPYQPTMQSSLPSSRYSGLVSNTTTITTNTTTKAKNSYISDYVSPLRRSVPPSIYSSVVTSSMPSEPGYNEFSDDPDFGEEGLRTPYLSKFARELERLKAEPLSSGSDVTRQRLKRHTMYEPSRRRPIENKVGRNFTDLCVALDEKYHIRRILLFLTVVAFFIYIFALYYMSME